MAEGEGRGTTLFIQVVLSTRLGIEFVWEVIVNKEEMSDRPGAVE